MPPHDIDWFGAGYAVAKGGPARDDYYPPLDEPIAQREWLAGFGAGWADCPDEAAIASILFGDGSGGESVEAALARALRGRETLLRQLRAHGQGRGDHPLH